MLITHSCNNFVLKHSNTTVKKKHTGVKNKENEKEKKKKNLPNA